jgi:hypothetical protein
LSVGPARRGYTSAEACGGRTGRRSDRIWLVTSRYDPTNPVDVSSVPEVADGGERCLSSPSFGDTVWFRASWRSWLKFHISFLLLGPSHEVLKFRTVIESPARDVSACLVCGDDWIEEPEGTSFPAKEIEVVDQDGQLPVVRCDPTNLRGHHHPHLVCHERELGPALTIFQVSLYDELGLRPGRRVGRLPPGEYSSC